MRTPGRHAKAKIAPKFEKKWGEEWERCANDPVYWFNTYCKSYDPRLDDPYGAFELFPRQQEFIAWLQEREKARAGGLVEKSRDSGASYMCVGYALWCWIFRAGFAAGFGSRKGDYVDKLGDPKSLFEKLRMLFRGLPQWQKPTGFTERAHGGENRLVNPSNGSTVTGESGDGIGRGGRTSIYFVDESAYIEHPKLMDASLGATTNVRIDISTPNGLNEFYFRSKSRRIKVFRLHWITDPRKNAWVAYRDGEEVDYGLGKHPTAAIPGAYDSPTPDDTGLLVLYPWYENERQKPEYEDKAILAQEVDIDYVGSGRPRFDRRFLITVQQQISPPDAAGAYAEGYEPEYEQLEGETNWHGDFTCYVEPEAGRKYVLLADTAKGLTERGDPDRSIFHVYDLETWEQCAHYWGRPEPHDFAEDISIAATMYGYCLVCVETPGPGETVLTWLEHHLHYANVYHYADIDKKATTQSPPGYPMNVNTKPELDGHVASMIRDMARGQRSFVWRHPNTVEEHIRYVRLGGSRCGGEAGGHDDEVACTRLAAAMFQEYAVMPVKKKPRHWKKAEEFVSKLRPGRARRLRG